MILAIRAKQYAVSKGSSLIFPQSGDLDNTSFIERTAYVSFPIELLSERAKGRQVVYDNIYISNLYPCYRYRQCFSG